MCEWLKVITFSQSDKAINVSYLIVTRDKAA